MDAPNSNRRILFTSDSRFAVTQNDGKPGTLTGYAIVWGTLSSDRGGYQVRFLPDSATFADPTLALFHHDFRLVIGNTANSTLRLKPDSHGLAVEIDLPDTSAGRDTFTLVRDKYIRGMSFSMAEMIDSQTIKVNGQEILEVSKFLCDEVTVTPIPAFAETSIDVKPPRAQHSARTAQSIKLARINLDLWRPEAEILRAA